MTPASDATLQPGVVYVLEADLADLGGGAGGAESLGGRLPADEARAWAVLPDDEAPLWAVLPDDERARAERMNDPGARRRFVTGRACLRSALARLTQVAARDIRFAYGAHGRPFLPGGPSFSLSHSGERVLIAVAAEGRVGADVERIRPVRRLEALAARWFAPGERAWLSAVPEDEREAAFFAVWTRKEAFAKALGRGLATPFGAFTVDMGAGGTLAAGRETAAAGGMAAGPVAAASPGTATGPAAGPGTVAAVAVRRGGGARGGGLAELSVPGECAGDWTVAGLATGPGTVAAVAADWPGATVQPLP